MSAVALYFIYSLSSIGHALYWYKFECTVLLSSTPAFPQVQAAIKKKVEKQKKRTNDQGGGGGGGGDAQAAARNQKSKLPPMTAAEAGEDSEALEEQLEELMEGPRRREKEKEKEEEPVDLLPIVDSVFGQVGVCVWSSSVSYSAVDVYVCVLVGMSDTFVTLCVC